MNESKPLKSGVVDADNGGSSVSNIRTSTGSFVPLDKAVQDDPIKPKLKPPGAERLKLM